MKRRAVGTTTQSIELPARDDAAANLPEELVGLAQAASVLRPLRGVLTIKRGQLALERCPQCGAPTLPGLSDQASWLENRLFVAQMGPEMTLIAFLSERVLAAAASIPTPPSLDQAGALALLRDERLRNISYLDGAGEWLALSGWNYSSTHRHGNTGTPLRESYLTHDPTQGVRFATSTAASFDRVAGREGLLLFAALDDLPGAPKR